MYRQTGPSRGNRRAPTAAPGRPRPTRQRGGGGNKAAGSPAPTAASSTVATVAPSGAVSGPGSRATRASAERTRRVKRQVTREERQRAAAALAQVGADRAKRARERASPRTPKPSTYLGRKTAGEPTKAELDAAHKSGTLKVNKAGVLTTPSVRQAAKKLRTAAAALAAAEPHITGLRNKAQAEFAEELSKRTGIPPKLAGEWVLQESGASSAGAGGEAGEQNQLGVGYPAHPTSFSESPFFNNTTPKKAADATAKWMEGKLGADYNYQAASSIQQIPRLAKSGASEEEIRAYIEGPSAWGTGTIAQSGVTAAPGKGAKKAARRLKAAKKEAKSLGLHPKGPTVAGLKTTPAWMLSGGPKGVKHAVQVIGAAPLKKWLKPTAGSNTGQWPNIADLNPVFARQLVKLAKASGEPIQVTSAYRSVREQEEISSGTNPKAPPGLSEHQFGMAADTEMSQRQIELAPKFGLQHGEAGAGQGVGSDPPHTSLTDTRLIKEALKYGPIRSSWAPASWESEGDLGDFTMPSDVSTAASGSVSSPAGSVSAAAAVAAAGQVAGVAKGSKKARQATKRSKRKLTREQRYLRNLRKLNSVGAPVSTGKSSSTQSSHPILEELRAKYGSTSTTERAAAAAP